MPEEFKALCDLWLKNSGKEAKVYSPQIRQFAITLSFYSMKAYKYLRGLWKGALRVPSTLRRWYTVVDGRPSFTKSSFDTLGVMAERSSTPVVVSVVLDEMCIKKHVERSYQGRSYGLVDTGIGFKPDTDNGQPAKSALVLMAVALNGYWKIPLGYFLVSSLTAHELANVVEKCILLLHDKNIHVLPITFDGASINISMCEVLGANFEYGTPRFKPWFLHHLAQQPVYVVWDACHMIKLIRNAFERRGLSLMETETKYHGISCKI